MPRTAIRRPSRINVTIPRAALARGARRAGSFAARAALDERHTLVSVASAAVLGYMASTGTSLPHISALGIPGTYGVAAWAIGRMTKSRTASHVATGLLAVQAYSMARNAGTAAPAAPTAASSGFMGGVL